MNEREKGNRRKINKFCFKLKQNENEKNFFFHFHFFYEKILEKKISSSQYLKYIHTYKGIL